MRLRCPAKINLALEVLGTRLDGYHEIRTLYQTIDFADRLDIRHRRAPGFTLTVAAGGMAVPAGERNLVYRAHELFRRSWGPVPGLEAHLVKRIPPGAGLGGGSSDAASMLLALKTICGRPAFAGLEKLAAELGSDVPFFLHGGTAAGRGRGERVMPLPDAAKQLLLLVLPSVSMPTAEVYRAWNPMLTSGSNRISIHRYLNGKAEVRLQRDNQRNDLESVVFGIAPELAALKGLLYSSGAAFASLSGSGSALFGLFDSEASARAAAGCFAGRSCRTVVARFQGRSDGPPPGE